MKPMKKTFNLVSGGAWLLAGLDARQRVPADPGAHFEKPIHPDGLSAAGPLLKSEKPTTLMKAKLSFALAVIVVQLAGTACAQQYQMPQDNWFYTGLCITNQDGFRPPGYVAIGPDDNIYAAATNHNPVTEVVKVYRLDGTFLNMCTLYGLVGITGIAVSSETNLYVMVQNGSFPHGPAIVKYYYNTEDEVGGWTVLLSVHLSGVRQGIAMGKNDQIYLVNSNNYCVEMYDKNLTFLGQWGQSSGGAGGIASRFWHMGGIAALPNGNICVGNSYPDSSNPTNTLYELQLFDSNGGFITLKQISGYPFPVSTPDGLVWTTNSLWDVYPGDQSTNINQPLQVLPVKAMPPWADDIMRNSMTVIAVDRHGTLYEWSNGVFLFTARRLYGIDAGLTSAPPPQPFILSVMQRPNTSLVDIDYRVTEPDTNEVTTALLAFLNNGNDLASLRKPTVFMENTGTNLGPHIAANADHRVTWDASELGTSFQNLQFEILAQDGRGLLAFNFVTVPAADGQPAFTLSRSGVSDNDLLSLWYWFIGTNCTAITLTNGSVVGVGGAYNGQTLASGTNATAQGRQFLYGLLGVRSPTTNELSRASSGNYGFWSVSSNNVVKLSP